MKLPLMLTLIGSATITGVATGCSRFNDTQRPEEKASIFLREALTPRIEAYRRDIGRYPSANEGLVALRRPPDAVKERWRGPYIPVEPLLDPWGSEYRYRIPALRGHGPFELWSMGPDKAESKDDIGNWE